MSHIFKIGDKVSDKNNLTQKGVVVGLSSKSAFLGPQYSCDVVWDKKNFVKPYFERDLILTEIIDKYAN